MTKAIPAHRDAFLAASISNGLRWGVMLALFCGLSAILPAAAQTSSSPAPSAPAQATLPDSPQPRNATLPNVSPGPPIPWLSGRLRSPGTPLTSGQKFTLYIHRSCGPPAIVAPAFGAAIRMANPPSDYPREWKDGAQAFGRLNGSTLATQTSKRTAEFLTEAAFHYDARYSPSQSTNAFPRIAHALEYVFVEKTDSGSTAIALPHFAGAAAGGFVGMAYLPSGYDTVSRSGQRAITELGSIAAMNIAQEFAPELAPIFRRIHIPKVVPVWWIPKHRTQPTQSASK